MSENKIDDNFINLYRNLTFKSSEDSNVKRENANINGDTAMGTMLKYGSEGAKEYFKKELIGEEFVKAHEEGDIHIHDMDFYPLTMTCCQIDLLKLFKNGFSTGHGFLREPNSISSYAALACIAIQSNQNDQHGGQSIPNFDYAMAEGVRKSFKKIYRNNLSKILNFYLDEDLESYIKEIHRELESKGFVISIENNENFLEIEKKELSKLFVEKGINEKIREKEINDIQTKSLKFSMKDIKRETFQAMEAFIHNLNTMHSRAGAQVPFSSINYGTDTSVEATLVISALLDATDEGLGNGETPIFPIQIFKVKEGINYNEEDPNYPLFVKALKISAKRLFPNFSFLDAPFNKEYYIEGRPETEVTYMGCRTRVMGNTFDKNREIAYGRGNLSFTSINLPRIAIKSKGDLDAFYKELEEKIELVEEQLLSRFEIQGNKKVKNFPFLMGQGVWIDSENLKDEDFVRDVIKHGTLSIGFIGLGETLKALTGKHHGESDESQELGLEIISFMREKLDEKSKETNLNWSLVATPAEGLSGRFTKIDREKFGNIKGVTDREYYTNSFHIPVYYPISIFQKIKKEAPYHQLTNGGHISYVELDGDPQDNIDAFMSVVRAMKEAGVGYGSINHPVDRDPVCGYTGIIGEECPRCHRKEDDGKGDFERIRRITGYLVGTMDKWNDGKRAEARDRVKHGYSK